MSETNPNEANPNPYAPGIVQKKEILSDVEEMRRQYLAHEASVKSIGILFIIGGLYCLIASASIADYFQSGPRGANSLAPYLAAGFLVVLAIAQLVTAFGLRKLKRWSRIPASVLACIGLLAIPIGTIINAYVLFLLFAKKSSMVFSPEYKEVIAQTPHMKYKTSFAVFVLMALIVSAIVIFALRFAVVL